MFILMETTCMSVADCTVYRAISTRASGICPCFADASSKLADGEICIDFPLVGICSGGVCGDSSGEAAAVLVGALDPDASGAGIFFEQLAAHDADGDGRLRVYHPG